MFETDLLRDILERKGNFQEVLVLMKNLSEQGLGTSKNCKQREMENETSFCG